MSNKTITANQFNPVNIKITGKCSGVNPFTVNVKGRFTAPDGKIINVPGFYYGENTWVIRFAPNYIGLYNYEITSEELGGEQECGKIICEKNTNLNIHGALKVNPDNPYHFQCEDGSYHFMMAYECDWLWALDMGDEDGTDVEKFVDMISSYGFNGVIMNIYAHSCGWSSHRGPVNNYGPPALYAWEGTNDNPDHSRLNSVFFRRYDKVMKCLHERGMYAHLLLKVYNKNVNWPEKYSAEEDLYFKYITARYQAFPNVIWDFSKEAYYERDKDYISNRIKLIKDNDGHNRPVTLHDDKVFYKNEVYAKDLDFLTAQQHDDFYYHVLYERNKKEWPIFNSEFGYEFGPAGEGDTTHGIGQTAEEVIRRAYEIVCAGGYIAYYYNYTAWDIVEIHHRPIGYTYFKILYDFFTSIKWWELEPAPEATFYSGQIRCICRPGKEYIVFQHHALMDLDVQGKDLDVSWLNIYTGEKVRVENPMNSRNHVNKELFMFECPFDCKVGVLHIKLVDQVK